MPFPPEDIIDHGIGNHRKKRGFEGHTTKREIETCVKPAHL